MEDLNKNQIILLALLVSFVAAVATSIMTYSLLNEAPPTITQTINRVVERTVETVVPQQSKPDVITKEVTVVVKEEDLVIDSIAKNKSSIVRIWRSPVNGEESKIFLGIGLIVNKDGLIMTGKIAEIPNNAQIEVMMPDGKIANLDPLRDSDSEKFSFFKIKDLADFIFTEVVLGNSDSLQLGQSIISIEGIEKNEVSTGRVTGIESSDGEDGVVVTSLFETDVLGVLFGSPAINLKGEIVGIGVGEEGNFIPANLLKTDLEALTNI